MIDCFGMTDENYTLRPWLSINELMVGAQHCDAVKRVNEAAVLDAYPFPAGHANYLRDAQAWGELGGMVVGGEF